MKKPLLLLINLCMAVILLTGCGQSEEIKEKKTENENIKTSAAFSINSFTDPGDCGRCHNTLFQQWEGSMHNNALKDPIYKKLVELGSKETNGEIDEYCSRCHGPIAVLTGEIPPVDGSMASDLSMKAIQCDFCHTVIKGGISNGAFENEPGDIKRGPLADARPTWHKAAYSELHTKSEFCGMCHDVNHPTNGIPLEATYTEWKNSPYAAEGIQCQDCHMTPGPGVTKPNPGQAVSFGPQREHIYTHSIAGGNFAVAGMLGSPEHQRLAEERLKAAGKVEIQKESVKLNNGSLEFQVKVSNVGAGHYLPTGLTETREMWLEATLTDKAGKVIWQSGGLDEKGNIKSGAVLYNTVILDKTGHHTDKVWFAEKIGSDYRIPPKGHVIENYSVKSDNLPGDANLTVRLLYRSAPQRVIDELFQAETFKMPILEMTKDNLSVKL